MIWKDKLNPTHMKAMVSSSDRAEKILADYLPKIRGFFRDKIGPAVATAAKDDEKMTAFSKTVYGLLPTVVRLAVSEGAFVQFCFAHRDRLVTESPQDVLPPPGAPIDDAPQQNTLA